MLLVFCRNHFGFIGVTARHAPDYFVRRRDGSVVVVDVREDDRISDADRDVFDRSAATCAMVGWDYLRVGSLDPVLRANLRWLSGYRHPRVLKIGLADQLAEVFARVRPLMAGVRGQDSFGGAARTVSSALARPFSCRSARSGTWRRHGDWPRDRVVT